MGDREAKGLDGLKVDEEEESIELLDRQVSRISKKEQKGARLELFFEARKSIRAWHLFPNHRFTTSFDVYGQMAAQGWMGEGVVMCAVP